MEEFNLDDFKKELKASLDKEQQELGELTRKLKSSKAKAKIIAHKRFLIELIVLKMDLAIELTPEDYNIISEFDS